MQKLQLMNGGQVFQTTGLKSSGLDYKDQVKHLMDEQMFAQTHQVGAYSSSSSSESSSSESNSGESRPTATYTSAAALVGRQ